MSGVLPQVLGGCHVGKVLLFPVCTLWVLFQFNVGVPSCKPIAWQYCVTEEGTGCASGIFKMEKNAPVTPEQVLLRVAKNCQSSFHLLHFVLNLWHGEILPW